MEPSGPTASLFRPGFPAQILRAQWFPPGSPNTSPASNREGKAAGLTRTPKV